MTSVNCNFPTCHAQGVIPHDMHLLSEPGSPYPMRVAGDRRSVMLWLADGTLIKRAQPDAVRKLRADVRAAERSRWAAEDRVDEWGKR
jgi:hypothetical protein